MNTTKLISLLLALGCLSFAGQSLQVSVATASNTSVAAQAVEGPCRIEGVLHDWDTAFSTHHPVEIPACGIEFILYNLGGGAPMFYIYWERGTPSAACIVYPAVLPTKYVAYRFQVDHSTLTTNCEFWDINGTRVSSATQTFTGHSGANSNGASVTGSGAGQNISHSYFRVFTSLVAMNSRPPVTADVGDLLEWKFDNNLNDSSGHGYTATMSGGSAAYVTSAGQPMVVPILKTYGAPVWANTVSLRAGSPGQLDGSASYSQADASAAVTYFWQLLSGPSTPIWSSRTSATPTLTGLTFGDYHIQLTATDAASTVATASAHIGAVATDANGVVVNANPNVDAIFGPMIAFGRSPWGYMDERALAATTLRKAAYETPAANGYSLAHPSWIHDGAGTVSHIWAGVGGVGVADTTLTAGINATTLTIPVADATKLDLTGLPGTPVWICINGCYYGEHVRICSASGNTLTACYDGRGVWTLASGQLASAWNSGTHVGQYRINGSGTSFLTDSAVPICPAGAPGPAGRVLYSTGTVTMTPGSAAVTGTTTNWTTANGVTGGGSVWMRVAATHDTGTPFVFWAYVTTVTDTTHITLARVYPSDADAGTFNYKIVQADTRLWGLGYTRTDASSSKQAHVATGCESETTGYAVGCCDTSAYNTTTFSGKPYTYQDGYGMRSAYGANFYGEGLAHRALYYRSGLTAALTAASEMDDNWIRAPEVTSPGGSPLLYGGAGLGAIVNVLLNTAAPITWNDMRPYISVGAIGAVGCNGTDTRDSGYLQAMLTLGANHDPDAGLRVGWKSSLASVLTRDQNCKGSDNSWANGFYHNTSSPHLTLTNGSAVATGIGLTAGNTGCKVTASGTGSATNGSATLTGTGFAAGTMIAVTGALGGSPYTGFYSYSGTSSPLTLSVLWPGDSGSITWMITSGSYATWAATIGVDGNDAQLAKNWVCMLDSDTQITLQRAWDGPGTTTSNHIYSGNLSGFGQQPYMLGIKAHAFNWASQNDDPTISAGYAALLPLAAAWGYSTGYDPSTQGQHYGRVFGQCEPYPTAPASPAFGYREVECNYGTDPASTRAARVLTAETSSTMRAQYEAVPTPTVKAWGDTAYGSIWGYAPYTTGGVYSDSNYVRDENSDVSLGAYKWTGFFFGMGMAHQWPAVRLGGVAAAINRTAKVGFSLPAGATKTRFSSTAPTGATTVWATCATSPCTLTLDARQGNHLMLVEYLSAADAVLASSSEKMLVTVQ